MTTHSPLVSPQVQAAADQLIARLGPRVGQRFAALVGAGVSVAELEQETDTLVEEMERLLPAPSPAAHISGPVWTTEQVRVALGRPAAPVSRQAIDDRLRRGTVLALRVTDNGERAYPLWQFRQRAGRWEVIAGLADVLRAVPETVADRWTLASWLRQPHPGLDGQTPLEQLLDHGGADEQLLSIARATGARWAA